MLLCFFTFYSSSVLLYSCSRSLSHPSLVRVHRCCASQVAWVAGTVQNRLTNFICDGALHINIFILSLWSYMLLNGGDSELIMSQQQYACKTSTVLTVLSNIILLSQFLKWCICQKAIQKMWNLRCIISTNCSYYCGL